MVAFGGCDFWGHSPLVVVFVDTPTERMTRSPGFMCKATAMLSLLLLKVVSLGGKDKKAIK
jgi:hypothetical protein